MCWVMPPTSEAVTLVVGGYECYLPMAALVDLARERERIQAEVERAKGDIERAENLLGNDNFVSKAPKVVVAKERTKLADATDRYRRLQQRLEGLA